MLAMQDDYMKRVRGGGARDQLRAEGIVIFGTTPGSGCPSPVNASRPSRVIDA